MRKLPPVRIELNYDLEHEHIGKRSEEPDARLVKVAMPKRKIKPGTLNLDVSSPDDESGKVLLENAPATASTLWASDPAEAAGAQPCVVRIRPGTETYADGAIEFRMELALDSIMAFWGTVENAASQEHPIVIAAEAETSAGGSEQLAKRQGIVTINLNSIRWKWTPLLRDENGNIMELGPAQEDSTIEVALDGTSKHGFKLELERREPQKDGGYGPAESDFVHYLSPDHKCDFEVLAPDPIPWEIAGGGDQRQIVTYWWCQELPAEYELLKNLPVETTIRVRAYPQRSIQKHNKGAAPRTKPPQAAVLATREIPLRLGRPQWKTEVVSPNPDDAPVQLEGDRPWEDSLPVKIRVLDDADPAKVRLLTNEEVDWELLPDEDGGFCGMVKYGGEKDLRRGTWKVDETGCVEFRFCPKRENALFLAAREGLRFHARFNIHRRGSDGGKGAKIHSTRTPDKEDAPSTVIEWAPKFDLAILKLPFFIKPDAPLDLEAEPDAEKAEPVTLTLSEEETKAYNRLFRTGGTVMLRPVMSWGAGEGEVEHPLQHYKLVVGEHARKSASGTAEARQVLAVDAGQQSAWPDTVTIPAQNGDGAKGTLELKPQVSLHPEILERFRVLGEKARELDSSVLANPGLSEGRKMGDWEPGGFHKLCERFGGQAVRYFCETPSDKLCATRKGIRAMLGAMASFIEHTQSSWEMLGDAVALHRQIYSRYESTLVNGYFDIFGFEHVKKKIEPLKALVERNRAAKYILHILFPDRIVAAGFESVQNAVIKSRLAVWFGNSLDKAVEKNTDELQKATDALEKGSGGLPGAKHIAQSAKEQFQKVLQQCQQDATALAGEVAAFVKAGRKFRKEFEELTQRGLSGHDLTQAMLPTIREMFAAWEKVFESREKFRGAIKAAFAEYKAAAVAHGRLAAAQLKVELHGRNAKSLKEIHGEYTKLLNQDELEADAAKEFLKKVAGRPAPLGECQAVKERTAAACRQGIDANRESLLALLNQHHETWKGVLEFFQPLVGHGAAAPLVPPPAAVQRFTELCEKQIAPTTELLQKETARLTEEAAEFGKKARELADYKLDGVYRLWYASWKTLEELVEGEMNAGEASFESVMDKLLYENEPNAPPPTDLLGESSTVMLSALQGVKKLISSVARTIAKVMVREAFKYIAASLWGVVMAIRGIVALLTLLLTFVRSVLGKWAEAVASFFEWIRELPGGKFSCLTGAAFQSGDTAARESQASPDLFAFSYVKEIDLTRRVRQTAEELCKEPVWVDKAKGAMHALFKTGYDDYYGGQLHASRLLFLRLCTKALDRQHLDSPPIDNVEDSTRLAFAIAESRTKIKRQIASYARALEHAEKDESAEISEWPRRLWAECKDQRGFNSVDLDILAGWAGFCSAWAVRIWGCFIGCAGLLAGPEAIPLALGTVGASFAAAEVIDFATASSQMVCALLGYYPYGSAYPRDTVLLPAVYYSMAFNPPGTRFGASKADEIVGSSVIDAGY